MNTNETPNTTDQAINSCDEMIKAHRKEAERIGIVGGILLIIILFIGFSISEFLTKIPTNPAKAINDPAKAINDPAKAINEPAKAINDPAKAINEPAKAINEPAKAINDPGKATNGTAEIPSSLIQSINSILIGVGSIFVMVLSVFISLYRFHLNEIAKAEHYKIGFMRIRVAASNEKKTYQSEVRKALTDRAFAYEAPSHGLFKNKRIESPLPGHITTDVSVHMLDKLLEKFDVVERKKKSEGSNPQ